MDTKTAEFLSKLVLEENVDDIMYFAFPKQKSKIKCSISMLAEISPLFKAMLSRRWCQESVDNAQLDVVDLILRDKTIELSDDVPFDQYVTFKLLIQILYGLRKIESLTVDQATDVYFYSDKYQIKDVSDKIQKFLNERMETGMSKLPFSVSELTESIGFAQLYGLVELKNQLENVKLAFDENNALQFWELTTKFEMKTLQQQVLDHVKTISPEKCWPSDLLLAVIGCFQTDNKGIKEDIKKELEGLNKCNCNRECYAYCTNCGNRGKTISSVINCDCIRRCIAY